MRTLELLLDTAASQPKHLHLAWIEKNFLRNGSLCRAELQASEHLTDRRLLKETVPAQSPHSDYTRYSSLKPVFSKEDCCQIVTVPIFTLSM